MIGNSTNAKAHTSLAQSYLCMASVITLLTHSSFKKPQQNSGFLDIKQMLGTKIIYSQWPHLELEVNNALQFLMWFANVPSRD